MHHDINDGIQLTMGPLGTLDGRYIIAIIQALREARRDLDNGDLPNLVPLIDFNGIEAGNEPHVILISALDYSGLGEPRNAYMLADRLYGLLLSSGAPTRPHHSFREIDLDALAKASVERSVSMVTEAMYSLGDVIKFGDNFYRMPR